jgi:Tol biopolymer transport system component
MALVGTFWKFARPSSTATPAMRFVVTAPEGTTLSPSASFLAVAPNGRLVAFLASRPGQETRVWIRSLDSLDARELMGTEAALAPFWSPDSRHLGFFANNQLKTVSVAGEAPRVLCELAAGTKAPGGTWSRNGVILFSQPAGIYRTDAGGVSPRPVTVVNRQLREASHLLPHFLPDGRHFLYVVRRSALSSVSDWIFLKSLDAHDEKALLPAESQALYAEPGYLLFLRNGSLVAQRFSLERMELQNDPLPVSETTRIGFNPATPRAMFSVSQTGVLAYRRSRPTELGWFDRSGKPVGWTGISGDSLYPALSPDGQRLAVSQYDESTSMRSIWLLDLRLGGTPTRLTSARSWETCPVWSPDGTAIAFGSGTAGATRLYEKEVNTAADEQPLGDDVNGCPLGWSPKGDYVLYSKAGDLARPESTVGFVSVLYPHDTKPIRVHEPTLLTGSWSTWPQGQLSPDGRFLAYVSDVSGRGEIYVRLFPDGARGTWQISDHGGTEPQWRDDGRELYFVGADKQLMAVSVDSPGAFRAGAPTALFHTDLDPGGRLGILGRNQYVVAEHGQRFLINQRRTETQPSPVIVVINWPAALR